MVLDYCIVGKQQLDGWVSPYFLWSSHTTDLKIGTLVATLPGAMHYRVTARTGWPGVHIL